MALNKTLRREIEVAFSKHAQPAWFRVVKYTVLIIAFYFFRRQKAFWIVLLTGLIFGLILHFWYRYKTQGWTKSYGMWNYEKNKSKLA